MCKSITTFLQSLLDLLPSCEIPLGNRIIRFKLHSSLVMLIGQRYLAKALVGISYANVRYRQIGD